MPLTDDNPLALAAILWITFPKERYSSKQVNILILKATLFISQNIFQSIHTSSVLYHKNDKYSKFTCLLKTL